MGRVSVSQVTLRVARAKRNNLSTSIENPALFSEKEERKGKLECLTSLDITYVGTASTNQKEILKMEGLKASDHDSCKETSKRRWDCRGDLVSKEEIVLCEEYSIAPILIYCQMFSGKLGTSSFESRVKFPRSSITNMPLIFCIYIVDFDKRMRRRLCSSF